MKRRKFITEAQTPNSRSRLGFRVAWGNGASRFLLGGPGGARLPSIPFRQRAWFSEHELAGEHRLPHLRACHKFRDIRSSESRPRRREPILR